VNKPVAILLDDLKLDEKNARKHPDRNLQSIITSLKQFGQQKPIVIDAKNRIVAGNGLYLAAKELGWAKIQAVRTELSGKALKSYAIADNRTAELAEWELPNLIESLEELQSENGLFDACGFTQEELDQLLAEQNRATDAIQDEVPEKPKNPISKLGTIWELGQHRLICGDSTQKETVENLLQGVVPFIMVTDPPYGVDYDGAKGSIKNDDRFDWTISYQQFSGDVVYVWHSDRFGLDVGLNLRNAGFEIRANVIWVKDRAVMSRGHYNFQHESAWYAVRVNRKSKWCGDMSQSSLWRLSHEDENHPTVKPVECMARPIRNHGGKEDHVYDPFVGSGTTIIACEQLKRRCFAIEIDPGYVNVCVERWENFTGQKAVRVSG